MTRHGFMITRLALTGPTVEAAELRFRAGLNVITGPSDTGKTFAFECIDFMLGASRPPKTIPEADGYDSVCLDIRDRQTNEEISLTRSLKGGSFKLDIGGKKKILGDKHKAENEDTASQFLLKLSNLQDKMIRKNASGQTRAFSFRHMAHLSVISEEEVIKNRSPILSGQYVKATEEKSAYTLLLSGSDDSSIVEVPDPREIKGHFEAKEEVLVGVIASTKSKIEEISIDVDLPTLNKQLGRLEHSIHECEASLNERMESAAPFEEIRHTVWGELNKIESRLGVLSELQSRFFLLYDQYQSDILRLQAIAESGARLGEMSLDRCPVCGALPEDQDKDHQECQIEPLDVARSCISEISKIKGLISDLELTQDDVKIEIDKLSSSGSQYRDELTRATQILEDYHSPRISDAINNLKMHQEQKEHLLKAISLYEQLNELEELLKDLQKETTKQKQATKPTFAGLRDHHLEAFAKAVQRRLEAWKFPNLDRVTFDKQDWDIVISGRNRSSHGKGVRAVTHAAFTLSLLRYCLDSDLPHSGVVVIDSPLVVYRQPDAGEEGFSSDVKLAFYYDLSQSYQDAQVIVIENDAPPDDLDTANAINLIRFTGTNQGRRGFIPTPSQSDKVTSQ